MLYIQFWVWGRGHGKRELRYLRREKCRVKIGDLKVSQSQAEQPEMNEQQRQHMSLFV